MKLNAFIKIYFSNNFDLHVILMSTEFSINFIDRGHLNEIT